MQQKHNQEMNDYKKEINKSIKNGSEVNLLKKELEKSKNM